MQQYFQMIHWDALNNKFHALLFVLLVLIVLTTRWYKAMRALRKLSLQVTVARKKLILNASVAKRALKSLLFLIGSLSLALVLLRPQWDKREEQVQQAGRDILIAVDISRSMLGTDIKPNRLEFAKKKIKTLLSNLSCERVGLLLFSGDTVLQCPLTKDYALFFMFLDQLDVETISSGTTSIDGAIRKAVEIYENNPQQKTKLLCVFTDGEDFSSNLAGVKEKALKIGLSIFTLGVGTTRGAPIPIVDAMGKQTGFEKDSAGKIIMSKLNEGILKNLSDQTGGCYLPTCVDENSDIARLMGLVKKFEKDSMQQVALSRYQDQYPYFVWISLLCFAVEWVL